MSAALPSRRAVLGGVGMVVLSGCTSGSRPSGPPAPVDPDDAVRAQAVDREQRLLDAYDQARLAMPDQAVLLAGLRGQHEQHLLLLVEPAPSPSGGASSPEAASPEITSSGTPPGTPSGSASVGSLVDLVRLERDTAAAHTVAALAARDGGFAALLASLAASEASHPVALA